MVHGLGSLRTRVFSLLPAPLVKGAGRIIDSRAFTLPCLCVLGLPLALALLFSLTYIAAFLYGLLSDHPLPSREIFLFFPCLSDAFTEPSALAKAVLAYAFAGFTVICVQQKGEEAIFGRDFSGALGRSWNIVSALVIFSLLFATLGAAHFSYYSGNSGALAGIIPYEDANGHYSHYTKYFYDGAMGDWVLRRPAAAFLGASMHWLSGNNADAALLVRCLLVCCAMWASCAVINKSFGVWSAIGCMALEYSYIWWYLHTFFSEPLGFYWGCTAAALWLQALRQKWLFWDLAAFSVTLVGLLTRMGSMFLIPALFIFILWRWRELYPGHGWWKKPLLGLCLCTAAIVLLNATFASRGEGERQQSGSNFSYSFAGLTLGTNWYEGRKYYALQLSNFETEKQKSIFLYKQGLKNILHSPGVFFHRLVEGEKGFLKHFNFFLFNNWYLLCLFGGLLIFRGKTLFPKSALAFWLSVWGGVLLSIPFIYFDSSWRVNIFVYPLIACFLSLTLSLGPSGIPSTLPERWKDDAAPRFAVILSGFLLLLMMSVALFPRVHTSADIQRIQEYAASFPDLPPNISLVDAKGMGFLVVPDGDTPDKIIPSMTWSTFRDRYQKFFPFADEALFPHGLPEPPFVVLNQIPVNGPPNGWGFFIAPPEVLKQKNVLLWEFEKAREIRKEAHRRRIIWKIVDNAKPVLYK